MELETQVIGPMKTNVHLVADARTREAIAIDAAIPGLREHLEGCPACHDDHESLLSLVGSDALRAE